MTNEVPKLDALIDAHLEDFNKSEKEQLSRARRFYRGDMSDLGPGGTAPTDIQLQREVADKNLIYPIADAALSSLLGSNPQVAATPNTPESEAVIDSVNAYIAWALDTNRFRSRAAVALIDSVLGKRGNFKTAWDAASDKPIVRNVDPSALFFDPLAREQDDIGYWLEAVAMPRSQFKKMLKEGIYTIPKGKEIRSDRYPTWMMDTAKAERQKSLQSLRPYVTVWEFYDRDADKVIHYVKSAGAVVLKDGMDYVPYDTFSLNHSGVDCRGISEVQLVLSQQICINDLLTLLKAIVYRSIPKTAYDAGKYTEETIATGARANLGSFVPFKSLDVGSPDSRLESAFFEIPYPQVPSALLEFIARLEQDAAYISALLEAQRGQVSGAKTATEMSIIEAQLNTRLEARRANFHAAAEGVAQKMLYLAKRHMRADRKLRIGQGQWASVSIDTLADVDVNFKMVAYNPVRQNPAVIAETLIQLLPMFAQAPNADVMTIVAHVVEKMGLPRDSLRPRQEIEAQQEQALRQAMMAAGQQREGSQVAAGNGMAGNSPLMTALPAGAPTPGPM